MINQLFSHFSYCLTFNQSDQGIFIRLRNVTRMHLLFDLFTFYLCRQYWKLINRNFLYRLTLAVYRFPSIPWRENPPGYQFENRRDFWEILLDLRWISTCPFGGGNENGKISRGHAQFDIFAFAQVDLSFRLFLHTNGKTQWYPIKSAYQVEGHVLF